MHLPSKNVPLNINPQPYLTAYLSASVAWSGYDRTNTSDERELGAAASDTNALPVGTILTGLALNNGQRESQYLQNRPLAVFESEYGCAPLIKATWASAAYQSHAYSFALVACRQHLYLIVVEDDPKFREISLSLTTRDRWWEPERTLESLEPKQRKNQAHKIG